MRQWQAPLDRRRVLDKLKYFPIQALPNYAVDYARSYLARKFSRTGQVSAWGVALKDLPDLVRRYSLPEVCGLQWSRCVEHSIKALEAIPAADRIEVRYEQLVRNPLEEIERIMKFIGLDMADQVVRYAAEKIKPVYVGNWKHQLQPQELERLMFHISDTMAQLGYADSQQLQQGSTQTTKCAPPKQA